MRRYRSKSYWSTDLSQVLAALVALVAIFVACLQAKAMGSVTLAQLSGLPVPSADRRIQYGEDPLMFGDLRLPKGRDPHPVAVVIHGGCWRSENDITHISHLSAALTRAGIATWTLEYRRAGNRGGGWPGTFVDVARGLDYLRTLTQQYPMDKNRVVLVGHSAGGHLALWLAARRNLSQKSPIFSSDPIQVRGVVSLAGITDLRTFGKDAGYCNASVRMLLGGTTEEVTDRYAQSNPIELVPIGVPIRLLHGALDTIVLLQQSQDFAQKARSKGDDVQVSVIQGAAHFDLIAPFSPAWGRVEQTVLTLFK